MSKTVPKTILINIEKLKPSKLNVRINLGDLNSLSQSIKLNGIIEPLVVRKIDGEYEIIAGRRRYEAAKIAGLKKLPCVVTNVSNDEAVILSAVENVQRNNLTEEEIAEAFLKVRRIDPEKWTYERFAERIGVSRTYLHDIITAYEAFKILRKKNLAKSFKANPSEEERNDRVLPISYLKELGYTVKSIEDKIPEEEREKKIIELAQYTVDIPLEKSKAVFSKFKENPREEVSNITVEVLEEFVKKDFEEKREVSPTRMQIVDPEHSIFNYIHYLIDLLEKERKGKVSYVEKIVFKNGVMSIYFSGYEENIPQQLKFSLKHDARADGKDIVIANICEDIRDLFEILRKEIDKEEKSYNLIESSKKVTEQPINEVLTPREKIVNWRIPFENRNRMLEVFYEIRDRDKKAIWNELVNAPFHMLSEGEILDMLRRRGHSKEKANALLLEIKEEWLDIGWIEVA